MATDIDNLTINQFQLIINQLLYPNKRKFLRHRHKKMLFWAKAQLAKNNCDPHVQSTIMGVFKMVNAKINSSKKSTHKVSGPDR